MDFMADMLIVLSTSTLHVAHRLMYSGIYILSADVSYCLYSVDIYAIYIIRMRRKIIFG